MCSVSCVPSCLHPTLFRELDDLPLSAALRQPWIDLLAEVRYLFSDLPDHNPEELSVMTELRQRWEREKAELRAEGLTQGLTQGRAESILMLLRARGLAVSASVQARVLACTDLAVLERWLIRATTATSDTEVVAT